MTSFNQVKANDRRCELSKTQGNQDALSNERLEKLANQIAIGNATFSNDLLLSDLQSLLVRVAEIRRERLVYFIAIAIANDIAESRKGMQV